MRGDRIEQKQMPIDQLIAIGSKRHEPEPHTFNRRVIFIDEVTLDQLNRQTRFTDATAANNDELVLAQELVNGQNDVLIYGLGNSIVDLQALSKVLTL